MKCVIDVISAIELTATQKSKLEKVFADKHKGQVAEFCYRIDDSIIGGLRVIDSGIYYDASLKAVLSDVKNALS